MTATKKNKVVILTPFKEGNSACVNRVNAFKKAFLADGFDVTVLLNKDWKELNTIKPDVTIVTAPPVVISPLLFYRNTKYILDYKDVFPETWGLGRPIHQLYFYLKEWLALRLVDKITVLNVSMKHWFCFRKNVDWRKIDVVENGLESGVE